MVEDGLGGIFTPGERAVRDDQHGGHAQRLDAQFLDRLGDDLAGLPLVVATDLLLSERSGY